MMGDQESSKGMRRRIALLCEGMTRDPEGGLKRKSDGNESGKDSESAMNTLLNLMRESPAETRWLALASGAAVFSDILPNYRLRSRTAAEREQRLGKETFATKKHEEALLLAYQAYIKILENARRDNVMTILATRCLGQLWLDRPRFNFCERVVAALVESLDAKLDEAQREAISAFRQGFLHDKIGDSTLLAVRSIHALIRRRGSKLRSGAVLEALETLRVYSTETEAHADKVASKALDEAQKKIKHRPVRAESSTKSTPKQRRAAQESLNQTAAAVDTLEWQQAQRAIAHEFATLVARILDMGLSSQKSFRCPIDLTVLALRSLDRISYAIDPDLLADALRLVIQATHDETQDATIRLTASTTVLKLGPIVDATAVSHIQVDRNDIVIDALYDTLLSCTSISASNHSLFESILRAVHQYFLDARSSDSHATAFTRRAIALAAYAQPDIARVFLALVLALIIRYPSMDIDQYSSDILTLSHHFDPDIRRRTKLLFNKKNHVASDPILVYRQLFSDKQHSLDNFPVEPAPPEIVFASSSSSSASAKKKKRRKLKQ